MPRARLFQRPLRIPAVDQISPDAAFKQIHDILRRIAHTSFPVLNGTERDVVAGCKFPPRVAQGSSHLTNGHGHHLTALEYTHWVHFVNARDTFYTPGCSAVHFRLHSTEQNLESFRFPMNARWHCSHSRSGCWSSVSRKESISLMPASREWKSHTMVGLSRSSMW